MYKGKVALVTGASRGIGLEIVKHFLHHHATVIGLSRGSSELQHENYHHFAVDIGNAEAVATCFKKEIGKQFRSLDIVVNNAAVLTSQYAMILPISHAMDMLQVNLMGVFMVSREAAKLMRKTQRGSIINIGSMATSLEPMGDSIYAATKAGIIALANIMAKEFSAMNITCNTIGVTAFETDMLRSHAPAAQEKIKNIIAALPIPRMAVADDILNVIDFFASDRSAYITAQTIYLGGIN